MAIYYKFKCAKYYESIPVMGLYMSVGNLKKRIFETNRLWDGKDFGIVLYNAQTNEEYVNEATLIPKSTSVLVRRIPSLPWNHRLPGLPQEPIVVAKAQPVGSKVEKIPPARSMPFSRKSSTTVTHAEESEADGFGDDIYVIPKVPDLNNREKNSCNGRKASERSIDGRMITGAGFGHYGFAKRTPPIGYICHRCRVPGHFKQHCPTNGDPSYDMFRNLKPANGIPNSMLVKNQDGSRVLRTGLVAVGKPDEVASKKSEGIAQKQSLTDLPPELHCPVCKQVMKDAVFASKCCFQSFCSKCILDHQSTKSACVCGSTSMLADDLLPNRTLREAISRILASTTSRTEGSRSLRRVQDVEPVGNGQNKVLLPSHSAITKDQPKQPPSIEYSLDLKEGGTEKDLNAGEGMVDNGELRSPGKKIAKDIHSSKVTSELLSKKPESASVPKEVKNKLLSGKKRKKEKTCPSSSVTAAADMYQEAYQYPSTVSNSLWDNGMHVGTDHTYMTSFGCAPIPYMVYNTGPPSVPFAGIVPYPLYPPAMHGYMMPYVSSSNMTELGGKRCAMSSDDSEACSSDLKRKRMK